MVIFADLSELFICGVLNLHTRVGKKYGEEAEKWFIRRKEETNGDFLNLMRRKQTLLQFWETMCDSGKPEAITPERLSWLFFEEIRGVIPGTLDVFKSIVAYPDSFRYGRPRIIKGRPDIYMVSDHIYECSMYLEQVHPKVFNLFSKKIWSFDRGEIKSDPGFFDRLLRDLKLDARSVLFVDDLLVNCESACRSHIKAIRFTGPSDLAMSLKANEFVLSC